MKEKNMIRLTVILLLCFTIYYCCSVFYYFSGKNREYQPDLDVIYNSIYIDAKQRLFVGPHNSIVIADGTEKFSDWSYIRGSFWFDQLEPQYDNDGSIYNFTYVAQLVRGNFRYTENDTLIIKTYLSSNYYPGRKFVLQRYDIDDISLDELPLSEEAIFWLLMPVEP